MMNVVCTAAEPVARKMHRSVNLVEGDTLELHCEPWGWPKPTVSWRRESDPVNMSDPRITVGNESLVMESLTLDDRANYYCVVTSYFNDTEHEVQRGTLVRVKGWFIFSSGHQTRYCYRSSVRPSVCHIGDPCLNVSVY